MPSVCFILVELAARGFDIHTGFDEMVEATQRHLGVPGGSPGAFSWEHDTTKWTSVRCLHWVNKCKVSKASEVGTVGMWSDASCKVWFLLR